MLSFPSGSEEFEKSLGERKHGKTIWESCQSVASRRPEKKSSYAHRPDEEDSQIAQDQIRKNKGRRNEQTIRLTLVIDLLALSTTVFR
jgi:hypothetical protein